VWGTSKDSSEQLRKKIAKLRKKGKLGEAVELQADVGVNDKGTAYLGISPTGEYEHRELGAGGSFLFAGKEAGRTVVMIFEGIGMMFSRDVPATGSQGLAGPVGIVQISADAFAGGYASYLWFLALISINLALLNMLPLLPLDGGHVVVSIIERIRGRNISLRVFERVSMAGLALFGLLFLVAMYNDVGRIFPGYSEGGAMGSRLQVSVGGVPVGGGAAVVVQSMTNTRTDDITATLGQIRALATAGARIVRVAVPDPAAVRAVGALVAESPVPLVADVNFDASLAVGSSR
jgi:Zn-dependent protease